MNLVLVVAEKNTNNVMERLNHIMKNIALIFILTIGCMSVNAQVSVTEEPAISRVMNDFLYQNQRSQTVSGWRIMIISTNDRRKSENTKAKFDELYPQMNSYWNQDIPFYKVVVGAFESKDALQSLLLELKQEFPSAIPVVAQINKTELVP